MSLCFGIGNHICGFRQWFIDVGYDFHAAIFKNMGVNDMMQRHAK